MGLARDIYIAPALRLAPQIFSQIDRRPGSLARGCLDREYWHHRCVDFPCLEKQEAVLTLCLFHDLAHPDNPYRGNPVLLEWTAWALEFWAKAQRPNGSFDEWFPFENSLTATAFSSRCVIECLLRRPELAAGNEGLLANLERAGSWMAARDEHLVCNQEAGAISALYGIFLVTGQERHRLAAENKLERLLSRQDAEGWFPEYGGADVGYSSVSLAYLAKAWRQGLGGGALESALRKLVGFLKRGVFRDGSLGGCFGSRNTHYLLPLGPELLAADMPEAAELSARVRWALKRRDDAGLMNLDHRYLLYQAYFYLEAWEAGPEELPEPGWRPEEGNFFLKRAGWVGISNQRGQAVMAVGKGGALKAASFEGGLSDCGWTVVEGKRVWISSRLREPGAHQVLPDGLSVSGDLCRVNAKGLGTVELVLLRLYGLTLGRRAFFGRLLKAAARRALIQEARPSGLAYSRRVKVTSEGVFIQDRLEGLRPGQEVFLGGDFSYAFGPSTRTFRRDELTGRAIKLGSPSQAGGEIEVERFLSWDGRLTSLRIDGEARDV